MCRLCSEEHDRCPRFYPRAASGLSNKDLGRPRAEIVGEYTDEAISAYSRSRGDGLAKALEHSASIAADEGVCELWVQHSDRLARGDGKLARHVALWAIKVNVKIRHSGPLYVPRPALRGGDRTAQPRGFKASRCRRRGGNASGRRTRRMARRHAARWLSIRPFHR